MPLFGRRKNEDPAEGFNRQAAITRETIAQLAETAHLQRQVDEPNAAMDILVPHKDTDQEAEGVRIRTTGLAYTKEAGFPHPDYVLEFWACLAAIALKNKNLKDINNAFKQLGTLSFQQKPQASLSPQTLNQIRVEAAQIAIGLAELIIVGQQLQQKAGQDQGAKQMLQTYRQQQMQLAQTAMKLDGNNPLALLCAAHMSLKVGKQNDAATYLQKLDARLEVEKPPEHVTGDQSLERISADLETGFKPPMEQGGAALSLDGSHEQEAAQIIDFTSSTEELDASEGATQGTGEKLYDPLHGLALQMYKHIQNVDSAPGATTSTTKQAAPAGSDEDTLARTLAAEVQPVHPEDFADTAEEIGGDGGDIPPIEDDEGPSQSMA